MINPLSEATFMTSLERNGDIVRMASYAPLLANLNHTSWNPNLIYFNNKTLVPTVNYYVQQLFSVNQGDKYIPDVVAFDTGARDSTLASSCVMDSKTGDIILKIVNAGSNPAFAKIDLSRFNTFHDRATLHMLKGDATDKNTIDRPGNVIPLTSEIALNDLSKYMVPAYSLSVIRIRSKTI